MPKPLATIVLLATLMPLGPVWGADADALIKSGGCLKCHDVTQWKGGPPFKQMASKYASRPEDAQVRFSRLLGEGVGHVKTGFTPEEIQSVTQWILSR